MEDLTARARLVDASEVDAGSVTATVPRSQIEAALAENEPTDLILDVERVDDGGGRRIAVEWDRDDLERLLRQAEDDAIVFAFEREPLALAFDEPDVEGHGLREKALILTVAAATAAGAAGAANAYPDQGDGVTSSGTAAAYTAIEQTRMASSQPDALTGASAIEAARAANTGAEGVQAGDYGMPQATASDYAAAQGVEPGEYGMPQATAADYAAAQGVEPGQYGMPQVSPADEAAAMRAAADGPAGYTGIEAARSAEAAQDAAVAGYAGIDTVGAEVAAELGTGQAAAEYSALESARATEPAPTTSGSEGGSVTFEAPSPATAGALAGAAALAITGAAFMARSRRRLTPQG